MDLALIKTFLDLAITGNFSRTADRLHITQSATSARVKALEEALGCKLFIRDYSGASLTEAGQRFLSYAVAINRLWHQGRHEVALGANAPSKIGGGIHVCLWRRLALPWLVMMRQESTDIRLHLEVDYSEKLVDLVAQGILDFAVVYMPRAVSGLRVERLLEDTLVMVARSPMIFGPEMIAEYIYIDWSYGYREAHSEALPDFDAPPTMIGHPEVAMEYLERYGGAAYFPLCDVESLLVEGRLLRVEGAPILRRPSYLVYPESPADSTKLDAALAAIRQVAATGEGGR